LLFIPFLSFCWFSGAALKTFSRLEF